MVVDKRSAGHRQQLAKLARSPRLVKLRAISAAHLAKTGRRAFVVEIMTSAVLDRPPDDRPVVDAALPRLRRVEDHAPRGPPPEAGPPAPAEGGRRIGHADGTHTPIERSRGARKNAGWLPGRFDVFFAHDARKRDGDAIPASAYAAWVHAVDAGSLCCVLCSRRLAFGWTQRPLLVGVARIDAAAIITAICLRCCETFPNPGAASDALVLLAQAPLGPDRAFTHRARDGAGPAML